jgi:hypothetical protein
MWDVSNINFSRFLSTTEDNVRFPILVVITTTTTTSTAPNHFKVLQHLSAKWSSTSRFLGNASPSVIASSPGQNQSLHRLKRQQLEPLLHINRPLRGRLLLSKYPRITSIPGALQTRAGIDSR